jgi:putative transposase
MRPDMNLQMGEFVVMPNHFYAIIIFGENEFNRRDDDGDDDHRCCRDAMHCVPTPSNRTTIPNRIASLRCCNRIFLNVIKTLKI